LNELLNIFALGPEMRRILNYKEINVDYSAKSGSGPFISCLNKK
jgi:hypothetical protein